MQSLYVLYTYVYMQHANFEGGGLLLDLCRKYPVFGCGLLDYVLYTYVYMQHANFEGGGSPLGPV